MVSCLVRVLLPVVSHKEETAKIVSSGIGALNRKIEAVYLRRYSNIAI